MTYRLGATSRERLRGVHPDLIRVVELAPRHAFALGGPDFRVLEGLRTAARQRELVKKGASMTLDSRHLTGHAVDLGAWIGGAVRWDWPLYYRIAAAAQRAATELSVPLVWGGVWDRRLNDLGGDVDGLERAVAAYVRRREDANRSAFIDGPHFELDRKAYP